MRLTPTNFFSTLIFHPFHADTKSQRILALIASIACGVFSVGICHLACAIRNRFKHITPAQKNEIDQTISSIVKRANNTGSKIRTSETNKFEFF